MKKTLLILLSIVVGASVFAQTNFKTETNNSVITVENFNSKKHYLARDNIRFINGTDNLIHFKVWGKKKADSEKEFLCMLQVGKNDSNLKTLEQKLKKFKYVEIECTNGVPEYDVIDVEHHDLYLYISDFKPNPKTKSTAVNDR